MQEAATLCDDSQYPLGESHYSPVSRGKPQSGDERAAECAAFSDLDRWLDACPVELTDETKAGILAMVETTAGAKQRRGTS